MARVIVMSGHGAWQVGSDDYTVVPGKTTVRFYTVNMKTLSDALGGDLDRGIVNGMEPDQEGGAHTTVPNMRLFPPINPSLNIRTPPGSWRVLKLKDDKTLPPETANLQVQIDNSLANGLDLATILGESLSSSLYAVSENVIIWAACRAINLKESSRGQALKINAMQR